MLVRMQAQALRDDPGKLRRYRNPGHPGGARGPQAQDAVVAAPQHSLQSGHTLNNVYPDMLCPRRFAGQEGATPGEATREY